MNANKNRWLPCAQFEVAYFYLRSDRFAPRLGTSLLSMPSSNQEYKFVALNYERILKEWRSVNIKISGTCFCCCF